MKRYFSKSVFIALFAAAVIMTVVIAVDSMMKNITIVIDGKEQVVSTFKDTVEEVLAENGITIAEKDKLSKNTNESLGKKDMIQIDRAVPVQVSIDGTVTSYLTPEKTVGAFFETENIAVMEKDKVSASLEDEVTSGMKVNIDRAVGVTLIADGQEVTYLTPEKTVGAFFTAENVVVNELDKVSATMEDAIANGMAITIVRVTTEVVEENQSIAFAVQEKKDSTIDKGKTVVKQEGVKGERIVTKKLTFEDGVQVTEEVLSTEVLKEAVDKIVHVGTKNTAVYAKKPSSSSINASRGTAIPTSLNYSKAFRVEATAYAGHGVTATGTKPVRNPNGWSTIAVDRSVIPLGTKVYVENYGYAIAEDVGGAIKGNKIDIYVNSTAEAYRWGRRTVTIYILE
ncbi:ubiquitin-like domain-containing protein [Proteiniclasticum ruminis]|uniref:ubiquitin-like domain-containing protein n=3 Tax=Proteiniclasticum ruminis TaxID=398199 RepID=UPI0028A8AAFA|nr:ubiquitin-like domain-containing protein [Proteiniclasticum ruminis]